jgi:3-methyladenine DNA glycosylase/8-oxoguanine DNA glycosylase
MLDDAAGQLLERWHGDLRRLRDEAGGRTARIRELLTEFKGIGPTGADIFLREVQVVWPMLAPYADRRVIQAAKKVGLPPGVKELAGLAEQPDDLARLFSALVRVSRSPRAAEELRQAAGT